MPTSIEGICQTHLRDLIEDPRLVLSIGVRRFEFICVDCLQINDIVVPPASGRVRCHTYHCAGCKRELGKAMASAPPSVVGRALQGSPIATGTMD